MSKALSYYAYYVNEKVDSNTLTKHNYIGVDNMLPNKGGIVDSEYVPIEGRSTRFLKGDILIGNIRPYFKKIWLATFEGGCSPDVLCIRTKGKIIPEYLYSVLSQDIFFKYNMAGSTGSKMPRGDKNHIMSFPIPESNKQELIGTFVTNINKKIFVNNAIINELEALAKTLFNYWFLQFEFPNEDGKPYKSSKGKMIWNEDIKKEIPEGWRIKTISDCSTIVSGYPFKTETYTNEGKYNIYTIGNVQDGFIDNSTTTKIDFIPKDMDENCILDPGDIIMSLTGNVGRVGLVYERNVLLNQRVLKIIPKKEYRNLLYLLFRNPSFTEVMQRISSGTSQKNLSPNQVGDFSFAIPNQPLLDLFNKKINGFMEVIINNFSQNQELNSLRDFLLPLLINGFVEIK